MLRVNELIGFGVGGNPEVVASATRVNSAGTTSHLVNLPSGIRAGDLLIAIVGNQGDRTHTWPSGWVELGDQLNGSVSSATIGYKIADGSESGTITVTGAATVSESCTICVVIRGLTGVIPTVSTVATGNSTAPNSGSVARRNGLFLSVFGGRESADVTSFTPPSNYTTVAAIDQGGSMKSIAAIAQRYSSASSEDPAAWSISHSCDWIAWTIAI